ncbi:MAG: hypothetical protein ACYDHY_05890 [Acidiferrobacterales bacterium]
MTNGPADKPKHTPSSRHTLEEVLQSLQDLLRNELQEGAGQPVPPAAEPPAHDGKLPASPTPTDMIAHLEGSLAALGSSGQDAAHGIAAPHTGPPASGRHDDGHGPADGTSGAKVREPHVDAAGQSGIARDAQPAPGGLSQSAPAAMENPPRTVIPQRGSSVPANQRPDRRFGGEVSQRELPFTDAVPVVSREVPDTPGPSERIAVRQTEGSDTSSESGVEHPPPADTGIPAGFTAGSWHDPGQESPHAPATVEVYWDDIPVLQNAVDLAPGKGSAESQRQAAPAPTPGEPQPPPAATLPSAHAHRIAVLAAARLDVELRKSGARSLDSSVVTRLAQILEEMLAQGAANMDNNSSK